MEDPSRQCNQAAVVKPRLAILEFWGLGDLTFATAFIRAAIGEYEITIVGKGHARPLLQPTFPQLNFLEYDPPWTVFRGKYNLLRWDWQRLAHAVKFMRKQRFAVATSVRADPRDHLLMWLAGARRRVGFPAKSSGFFLTERLTLGDPKAHRVERWRALGQALQLPEIESAAPLLAQRNYQASRIDKLLETVRKPVLGLHVGARLPTRRWPEESFREVLQKIRAAFDFHVVLVPDPDGYGKTLQSAAESTLQELSIGELVNFLGRVDLLICNDSGPGHIASACGRPVIAIFGPTDPDWFHPWGNRANLVIRDICPWRPCFDYCKFPEPHCLTKLSVDAAWRDIKARIEAMIDQGLLPATVRKNADALSAR